MLGSGSQIAGTKSRCDNTARTCASILSVSHANGAEALDLLGIGDEHAQTVGYSYPESSAGWIWKTKVQDAYGRMNWMGIRDDYSVWRSASNFGPWSRFYGAGDRLREVTLVRNANGTLEAIGIAPNYTLYRTYQLGGLFGNVWIGSWVPFYTLNDNLRSMRFAYLGNGRLAAYGQSATESTWWRTEQTSPGVWSGYWGETIAPYDYPHGDG
jgi:hypothetical protein